jgi:hypothetical protein
MSVTLCSHLWSLVTYLFEAWICSITCECYVGVYHTTVSTAFTSYLVGLICRSVTLRNSRGASRIKSLIRAPMRNPRKKSPMGPVSTVCDLYYRPALAFGNSILPISPWNTATARTHSAGASSGCWVSQAYDVSNILRCKVLKSLSMNFLRYYKGTEPCGASRFDTSNWKLAASSPSWITVPWTRRWKNYGSIACSSLTPASLSVTLSSLSLLGLCSPANQRLRLQVTQARALSIGGQLTMQKAIKSDTTGMKAELRIQYP